MHFIPLSVLAAALLAAAAPSSERAEITIKLDLTTDNDAAGNFQAPLDSPGLDITESHGGDGPNLSDWQFNLHYNFSLLAHVTSSPRFPGRNCGKPQQNEYLVNYRPDVPYAVFGLEKTNFTLCRGKLLYDNSVFTVGPPEKPVYVTLGPSESAFFFETVKLKDRLYIKFNDPKFWFGSVSCVPRKGDTIAAFSTLPAHSLFTFFPFLPHFPLPPSICRNPTFELC